MRRFFNRFRALWVALDVVPWRCGGCQTPHYTPMLLWDQLKYRLICRRCGNMQDYPRHIVNVDPDRRAA